MIEVRVHIEDSNSRNLSRADQLLILRGQLTLLRMRVEQGFPVSVGSLARAESLAGTLATCEVCE